MAGINKVILVGHLGKDPEIKYLSDNNPVAKFSLATTESYKDKNGEWKDITEWHNIVAWRYLAEKSERSLKKGMLVYVEGKIKSRKYEKDGQVRYITEIEAENLTLLGGKKDSDLSESAKAPEAGISEPENSSPVDDDLPF